MIQSPDVMLPESENPAAIGDNPGSWPLGPGVSVISRHPCGLIALEKPVNILSHPNQPGDEARSVLNAPYDVKRQAYRLPSGAWVHLLHRIDSATSGILLLATHEGVASAARDQFAAHRVRKNYLAIVKGTPSPQPPVWADRLRRRVEGQQLRTESGSGLIAKTIHHYVKADANGLGVSLLRLEPLTGRTHQLRAQCQLHNCPILGDKTYGDFSWNRQLLKPPLEDRLYLHAHSVSLNIALGAEVVTFSAKSEPPACFAQVLERQAALRDRAKSHGLASAGPTEKPLWKKTQEKMLKRVDPLKAHYAPKSGTGSTRKRLG